jgi:CRISPR/Cas system-associated exonuclease Cas4 (RecB family)
VSIGRLVNKKVDPAKSGLSVFKLAEEFDSTYESKAGFTQKKTFAPSTIGYGHGNCARYWYIAFNGAEFEDTADAKAKANMENGTHVHTRLQERLSKLNGTYKVVQHEIEVTHDDPPIRGFLDTLIADGESEYPLEIKSAKDEVWSSKAVSMEPSPNHRLQLLTYMKIKGYKQGAFMYENKNDNTVLWILLNFDKKNEETIDYVFDWLRGVYKLYEDKTLPNRPAESKSKMPCTYCPVKNVCWKDMKHEEGDVEYPLMVVKK